MRAKVKTARRKASKLHGAVAGYVSLVDRGANETPFAVVKSIKGEKTVAIKKRGAEKKSHKQVGSGRKKADAQNVRKQSVMAKMVFDGDVFEGEDDVREELKKAEWEGDLAVSQNGDGDWEVRPDGTTDDDFIRLSKVETDTDGVEAYVGEQEISEEEEEEEDDDEASTEKKTDGSGESAGAEGGEPKAGEEDEEGDDEGDDEEDDEPKETAEKKTVSKRSAFIKSRKSAKTKEKKFDAWDARFSCSNSLAKALKAGMEYDKTPPGFNELQMAFMGVMGNIVGDEGLDVSQKQEALNKSALEYAEVVGGLDSFFDAYLNAADETVAKSIDSEDERKALKKWAESYGDFVADPEGALAAPETHKKAAGEPAAIDYNKIGGTVAELVAKAVEPLQEEVASVTDKLEALSKRRPTKKAADPEEVGRGAPEPQQKKAQEPNGFDRSRAIFG